MPLLVFLAGTPRPVLAEPQSLGPDPTVGPVLATGSYSLSALIEFALQHNPEVAATAFDGSAAAARSRSASAAQMPRVSIEGGYLRYGDDLRLTAARYNGELGVFGDNITTADLVVRVPLYTGGRLAADVRAAELLEASASQRFARTRSDLVFNVSSLYFGQLAQARLIEALTTSTDALAGHLKQVKALIAGRKAAPVDALRTEVKLADIRQRLLREQSSLEVQRRGLLNLMGVRSEDPVINLAGTLGLPAAEPCAPSELVKSAIDRRPDVLAARAELDAQEARVDSARAADGPSVNFLAAFGNRYMYRPSQQPGGLSGNEDASRVGITVEIPLFDGGRTSARVDEEVAKLGAQRARFDRLALQVRLDVETAHANLHSALERLSSSEKVIDLADESLRIEREKYDLGRGTVLDVFDAQSALLDARSTRIRALADANTARAQLAWATGENLP